MSPEGLTGTPEHISSEAYLCLWAKKCIMNYRWNFVKLRAIRNLRNNLKNILNDSYLEIIAETLNIQKFLLFSLLMIMYLRDSL